MTLNKGQERKYGAFLKSVQGNEKAAQQMFKIWMVSQPSRSAPADDQVAMKLEEAVAILTDDPKFKLGNKGYTVRRSKGKGASGFVATKNV